MFLAMNVSARSTSFVHDMFSAKSRMLIQLEGWSRFARKSQQASRTVGNCKQSAQAINFKQRFHKNRRQTRISCDIRSMVRLIWATEVSANTKND